MYTYFLKFSQYTVFQFSCSIFLYEITFLRLCLIHWCRKQIKFLNNLVNKPSIKKDKIFDLFIFGPFCLNLGSLADARNLVFTCIQFIRDSKKLIQDSKKAVRYSHLVKGYIFPCYQTHAKYILNFIKKLMTNGATLMGKMHNRLGS